MAKRTVSGRRTPPPFKPLLKKSEVQENLSPEICRNRDCNRRIAAMVTTRTAAQLVASAKREPGAILEMATITLGVLRHAEGEAAIANSALERLRWAAQEVGILDMAGEPA